MMITKRNLSLYILAVILMFIALNLSGRKDGYNAGYKQGQIDALTKNKIIYCLKSDALNQSTWQLCEE